MFQLKSHCVFALAVLTIGAVTATVLAGPIWDCRDPKEPGGTPDTSKTISGSGELATARCELTGQPMPLIDDPDGDFQDMFLIVIAEPSQFQMRTVDPFPGAAFNTQIWVFDSAGRGVLANSLNPDDPPFSFMGNAANDGSGSMIVDPGLYYVAVSGGELGTAGRFPVDSNGDPIFNFDPTQPELVYGPATMNPVAGWKGEGEIGDYEIEFIGVEFVPVPIPTLTEWGAILLALLLLVAGTIVIRQYQRRSAVAAA